MVDICLDLKSKVPIYVQIRDQLRLMIATGELAEGAQMPAVRNLAHQLLINSNTVAKAYHELEAEGYIHTQRGMGTFVSKNASSLSEAQKETHAEEVVAELVTRLSNLGLKPDDIRSLVDRILKSSKERQGE